MSMCSVPSWSPGPRRTTPCAVSRASRARSENLLTSMVLRYLSLLLCSGTQRHDGPAAHRHQLVTVRAFHSFDFVAHALSGLEKLGLQALQVALQLRQVSLQLEHALHPGQVEAHLGEFLDTPQTLQVVGRVHAPVARHAPRAQEPRRSYMRSV